MLAVLAIALVGVFGYQFGGSLFGGGAETTTRAKTPAAEAAPRFVDVDIDVKDLLQKVEGVNFDYQQARTDRDPMSPLIGRGSAAAAAGAVPVLSPGGVQRKSITGIVWDAFAPRAVVD